MRPSTKSILPWIFAAGALLAPSAEARPTARPTAGPDARTERGQRAAAAQLATLDALAERLRALLGRIRAADDDDAQPAENDADGADAPPGRGAPLPEGPQSDPNG